MVRGTPAMDQRPIQGGVEILPVTSCHRNQDVLWPDWHLILHILEEYACYMKNSI